MRLTFPQHVLSNLYFIGILIVLAGSSYLAMPDLDNKTDVGSGLSFIAMAGLAAVQIPFLLYTFANRLKTPYTIPKPRFITFYAIYFCWMTAVCILTDDFRNIIGLTVLSLTILVFPLMLSSSYYRARNGELNKLFFLAVLFMMACIVLQYVRLYSIANQLGDEKSHIAVSYFPLFILPVLLLPSSKFVRYLSILITTIVIISSIKRGGLIALGASLLVYVIIKQIVSGESKIKQLVALISVALVMSGVLYYLQKQEDNNVVERMYNITDDGGSGRDVLWEDTYRNIHNRDALSRAIGNGYRSAQKVSKFHLPAHNDVLEIWYDFGGIGIILYAIAFFSLLRYTIRLIKRKSRYAPHLAMTMTFYIFLSMISIVVLYFWMVLLMFTTGIIAGLADSEMEENIPKPHSNNLTHEYIVHN
jgi:O-antigen ligase